MSSPYPICHVALVLGLGGGLRRRGRRCHTLSVALQWCCGMTGRRRGRRRYPRCSTADSFQDFDAPRAQIDLLLEGEDVDFAINGGIGGVDEA